MGHSSALVKPIEVKHLISWRNLSIVLKMGHPQPFFVYFRRFKQTLQFLHIIYVKKCYDHPVYSTGIQTHNLRNTSLLP